MNIKSDENIQLFIPNLKGIKQKDILNKRFKLKQKGGDHRNSEIRLYKFSKDNPANAAKMNGEFSKAILKRKPYTSLLRSWSSKISWKKRKSHKCVNKMETFHHNEASLVKEKKFLTNAKEKSTSCKMNNVGVCEEKVILCFNYQLKCLFQFKTWKYRKKVNIFR